MYHKWRSSPDHRLLVVLPSCPSASQVASFPPETERSDHSGGRGDLIESAVGVCGVVLRGVRCVGGLIMWPRGTSPRFS